MSVITEFNRKLVLITGGSSGIGYALAEKFITLGANVAILARRKEQLIEAEKALKSKMRRYHQKFITVSADVSKKDALYQELEVFKKSYGIPDYLINCAGIIEPGLFDQIESDVFEIIMAVNYLGTVYPTKFFIRDMIQRASGYIVNVSSMAGLIGIYGYSTYTPTKFAIKGFSDVIRSELKPHGIHVSAVFPPDTNTPQLAYENTKKHPVTKALTGSAGVSSPEDVAVAIINGIIKNEYLIIPGFESKVLNFANNVLGGAVNPLMDWLIRKALKKQSIV